MARRRATNQPIDTRQLQFEEAVKKLAEVRQDTHFTRNFGYSNSARIIEGGLFACTSNLKDYSKGIAERKTRREQFIFLCQLTFPPQDEVYFAIVVTADAAKINSGLITLYEEGVLRNQQRVSGGEKPGKINNVVKFYVTDTGQIFFHNYDFRTSLRPGFLEPSLDPDFMARVDSIHFAIWPPAASARRGLLAREFIGYLGNLIGRDRVHELTVWPDAAAVNAEMQRMPETIPIRQIEDAITSQGGHYPGGEVGRLHASLNYLRYKHFVILTGPSGTGKTRLALSYARAVHGLTREGTHDPFLFVCPVRPDWTDPNGLTGYFDVLSNRYIVPQFLEAMLMATAHKASPVFVILDEMNLARVEHYLSDILSCLETSETLQLHSSGVPPEGSTGTSIPASLPLPSNLFIIGTVNIDETTTQISDKVLDRAFVIDMSEVDLAGFLDALESREPALGPARALCEGPLLLAQDAMITGDCGFGYRVAEDVLRYHAFATKHLEIDPDTVMDDLMVERVLVKLRGTARHRPMLTKLRKAFDGLGRSRRFIETLIAQLDEFGSFQASR